MLQESVSAYEASLTVKDKSGYREPARLCAEFFDMRGVVTPSEDDWRAFAEYVRELKQEAGITVSDKTLREKFVRRGKAFLKWCSCREQRELFADEPAGEPIMEREAEQAAEPEATFTSARPVRVNFMLDARTYEILSVLAIMERKTMTAILKDAAAMYISAHAEQAGILQAAFQQARSKNG